MKHFYTHVFFFLLWKDQKNVLILKLNSSVKISDGLLSDCFSPSCSFQPLEVSMWTFKRSWHSYTVLTAICEWWQWQRLQYIFIREPTHTPTYIHALSSHINPMWGPQDDGIKRNVTVSRGSNQSAFVCISYYSQCISVTGLLCIPLLRPLSCPALLYHPSSKHHLAIILFMGVGLWAEI